MGDSLEEDSLVEEGIQVEADKVEEDSRQAVVEDILGEGSLEVEDSLEEDNPVEEGIRVVEADILVVEDNLVGGNPEEGIRVVGVVATS